LEPRTIGRAVEHPGAVRSTRRVAAPGSEFAGFRFPPEVITLAVRWYLRFGLSYRDVEELLAERGVEVDHTTVFRWVARFTPLFVEAARPCRHNPGDRWFVDETYVKVLVRWRYLYRAVDQFGQVIDMLVSPNRDRTQRRPAAPAGQGTRRRPPRSRKMGQRRASPSIARCSGSQARSAAVESARRRWPIPSGPDGEESGLHLRRRST